TGDAGTTMALLEPSKLKAWPTSPWLNVVPLNSVPLLPLAESVASPSARHQPTKPAGAGTQPVCAWPLRPNAGRTKNESSILADQVAADFRDFIRGGEV